MRRRSQGGRYAVGDKLCPNPGCAIAYAAHLAARATEPVTHYVREIGNPRALYRIERGEDGVVLVLPTGA